MYMMQSKIRAPRKKIENVSLLIGILILLSYSQALAHNVTVFAWVEGDMVHVESKFSGGRAPVDTPVEVYDTQGNLLLKGLTDDRGEFSFKAPRKEEMKVVLRAGMGHKGEWTITLSDFEDVTTGPSTVEKASGSQVSATIGQDQPTDMAAAESTPQTASGHITAEQLQGAIEKALDEKLKPVLRMLVETRHSGPTVTDILGGIGYIFGLIGVAAYFSAKRGKS